MTVAGRAGLSPAFAARLAKSAAAHKYSHGHVLVLGGPPGRGGAARLAARAALRVGAGLVTLACPQAAMAENAAQLTAVMLRALDRPARLAGMLADLRLSALCLGPGLGVSPRTRALTELALGSRRSVVLDADALTAGAQRRERFFEGLHGRAVLTPHEGEFARLFPDLGGALAHAAPGALAPRRAAVREAAARTGAVVLLKGPVTIAADAAGALAESHLTGAQAAPWLATAGSGDVLAGLIAGLLARGFSPLQAVETAVALHGAAARAVGPGLIAEDLPEALPAVLRDLGLGGG